MGFRAGDSLYSPSARSKKDCWKFRVFTEQLSKRDSAADECAVVQDEFGADECYPWPAWTAVFQLGWVGCVCVVTFASALSPCGGSHISTSGPEHGNRTMVSMRTEHKSRTWPSSHGSLTIPFGSNARLSSLDIWLAGWIIG